MPKLKILCTSDWGNNWHPVKVVGTIVKTKYYGLTFFTHLGYNTNMFTCSEYKTGLGVGYGETRKDALQDAVKRIRAEGKKTTLNRLNAMLEKYGATNLKK